MCFDTRGFEIIGVAEQDRFAVDLTRGSLAGRGIEIRDIGQRQIPFFRGPDDRIGERMFAGPFDARCKHQNFRFVEADGGDD